MSERSLTLRAGQGGASAVALCRANIAQHSKSFALASRLLPPASRDEAVVLYTWCRRADDAIDLAAPAARPAALARLRAELDDVYAGRVSAARDLTLAAFQEVVHTRAIPRHYPDELLAGMEMDVLGTRYDTLAELHRYGFRVAGVVGLMMCHVMGVADARARRNAAHLGMAMQLTNIARDVQEDYFLGRLYVPRDLLVSAGGAWLADAPLEAGRSLAERARAPLAAAVGALLAEADVLYRSGDAGVPALPWRAGLAIRTARLVYARIGTVIARRGFDVLAGRAVVSKPLKLWLALRALGGGLAALPARSRAGAFAPAQLPDALRFPDDVLPL